MARLTKDQWQLARMDYEVHGLSYGKIVEKYGVGKSTVSDRAKKEGWQKNKTEHLVQKKFNALRELHETEQQAEQLEPLVRKSIDVEVERRLRHEELFTESAVKNQQAINKAFDIVNGNLEQRIDEANEDGDIEVANEMAGVMIRVGEVHARTTKNNKETVLGKNPDTAIQINNNGGSLIDEFVNKRVLE